MTQQTIDIGIQGNDGTGDSIRESFRKVNANFTELYAIFGAGGTIPFTALSDAPSSYTSNQIIMANTTGTALTARTVVGGSGITINASNPARLTISSSVSGLSSDGAPTLSASLNANNFTIGRLADPSQALVDQFNAIYGTINPSLTTTLSQLPVTLGYADSHYVKQSNNAITSALRVRNEPVLPETTDVDYNPLLSGNYVATEAVQRQHVVYRGGDTMTGALTLSDHPAPLSGAGTPNGTNDLQAATKYYVDNNTYYSGINLYVSTTKGDDTQKNTPVGREGRAWQYAYKTVGAAALQATNLITLAALEPGPYKQRIAYTIGPTQYQSTIQSITLSGGNSAVSGYTDAASLLGLNKAFIQAETIAYLNKKYVNSPNFDQARYKTIIQNIVNGVSYDLTVGSNFNSTTQASNLFSAQNNDILSGQLTQLIDGINYAKAQILDYAYNVTNTQTYIGKVIDALSYDVVFLSNFQSIKIAEYFSYAQTGLSPLQINSAIDSISSTILGYSTVANSPTAQVSLTANIALIKNIVLGSTTYTSNYPSLTTTFIGQASARDLLTNNIPFLQAEIISYLTANYPNVVINKTKYQQDVKYIVQSLIYDLMYTGNSQSAHAGLQYWVYNTLSVASYEVPALSAAIGYIGTLALNVVTNTAPLTLYQTSVNQYFNSTLSGNNTATATFSTGSTSSTSMTVVTGAVPISVGQVVTGTGFTGGQYVVSAAASGANTVVVLSAPPNTLPSGTLTFTSPVLASITNNVVLIQSIVNSVSAPSPSITQANIALGSSVLQTVFAQLESHKLDLEAAALTYINNNIPVINDTGINTTVNNLFATITNLLTYGISTRSIPTYTSPSGLAVGISHARAALIANLDFLAEEAYAYAIANYPSFIPQYGVSNFKSNMKYLIEAVCYDITYGGNSASLYASSLYYVNGTSILTNTEKSITGFAITHLQSIAVNVAANVTVAPVYSSTAQVKNSVWADGTAASSNINTLFSTIFSVITTNGSYSLTYPILTSYASNLQSAQSIIFANSLSIANAVNVYLVETYKGGFNYNQATCYRDIGYIVDAMSIDLLVAGTYQSINAGLSYYSNTSAKAIAVGTQYTETLDGILFAQTLSLQVLNQTTAQRFQTLVLQVFDNTKSPSTQAKTDFTNNYNLMVSIIKNGFGAAPSITTSTYGTGIYTLTISNGGNGYVDQGAPGDTHIIPAKILVGATSNAAGSIVTYTPGSGSGVDTIVTRLTKPGFFQVGEQMDFGETVKNLNITIRVESGIYYEDYPIKLPEQCSIKGDEFRRTIIRPLDRVSQSPWRSIFFYRDAVQDAMQIGLINFGTDYASATSLAISATSGTIVCTLGSGQASGSWVGKVLIDATSETGTAGKAVVTSVSGNILNCTVIYPFAVATTYSAGQWHLYDTVNYGRHYLTDPLNVNSIPKNNKLIDVLLCNDATRVTDITFQGHGGFAMVLDPSGQIKTKSPYGQVCTSFSQSINSKRFAGGQFVDGFAGRLFGTITNVASSPAGVPGITLTVTGAVNSGLDIRSPQAPCVFYIAGQRFQVDDVPAWNSNTYTATLTLDVSTPYNPNTIYNSTPYATTIGSLIDATTYDLVFGSNYQSVKAALTYLQPANALAGLKQLFAISGINKSRDLANNTITTPASRTALTNSYSIITDALTNGIASVPTATFPDYVGISSNVSKAKTILQANKQFIRSEIVAWIASNYSVKAIPNYSAVTMSNRIGYIVDALTYDLAYGGNSSTYDLALWYYLGGNQILGQETYYAAAFTRLQTIIAQIVQNATVTVSAGNLQTQNTSLPTATATEASTLTSLASILIDYVADGVFGTPTTRTAPTLPSDSSYTTVKSDRLAIQTAKTSIQTGVDNFLQAGAGLSINIEMGGNRSMLANDFAMINDLGYAIVVTNGGASEQVSTFSYYCHTHYWSNNGGQIRSVAGSNAHGDYGLRATGYDVTELPDSVNLAYDMVQTAYVYKQGSVAGQMTPTATTQALAVWIIGWEYIPMNNTEMEIDHSLQGGVVTRYLVSTVEHTSITVNGQNILKLNLSTAGTNSTSSTGLASALYDGQVVTLRMTQNIKFLNIDNVKPTRPSTAVQYGDNLADIYRIIAYNLTEASGEILPANTAVLQADATFNYYRFTTDGTSVTQLDPQDSSKTQGSKVGDNKIAVLQISQQTTIDQINKGIYLFGWAGRVHRVLGYTVPLFIATGSVQTYTAPGGIPTLVVTNVAGTIVAGEQVTGSGITGGTTVVSVTTSVSGSTTTATVILSTAATSPSGTITFGVAKNGYLTIDPNPVYNNGSDGTGISAMTWLSTSSGPTGTTYKLVKFAIPFATRYPVVDSYITIANQANTSYNGTYQISAIGNSTQITVGDTSQLLVDMIVTAPGAPNAYVPTSCIIQSIDSPTQFTVSPAAWIPSGTSVSATAVATLSSVSITNAGSGYTTAPTITVSGGGALNQAIVTCSVLNGSINQVVVVSPGYGYTSAPTLTLSYGNAVLSPVLTANPTTTVVTTTGVSTNTISVVYPTDPGSFTAGSGITVSSFGTKTGTGPYSVVLNIPSSTITNGAWYRVTGNTNILYNGYYQATSGGSAQTTITLAYPYNPGSWSTATTTTVTKEVTSASGTPLGLAKPFSTSTAFNIRLGYPAGEPGQITTRISTCRATGHDFLYIGTGSYTTTNWPTVIYGNPAQAADQSKEILEEGVGRVFYVTTDQNGVFRVGRFFTVDQGTGAVTFSASIALSNLDGLGFKRGVVVSEFSTDSSMTNNASDTVSVQSAVRAFVDKRLGLDYGGTPIPVNSLIGPGYLALNGTLAMKGSLNMALYTIQNLAAPTVSTDATNKAYVDAAQLSYNAIYKLTDTSITSAANGNLFVYDTAAGKWKNIPLPTGDVNVTYNSGAGTLTTAIQSGVISNTQISNSAAIAQSKLTLNIAGTALIAPSGNAAAIQAANGLSSFNSSVFSATNGWIDIITSTSTSTGITLSRIQYIPAGSILGNRSSSPGVPSTMTPSQVVTDGNGLSNAPFTSAGAMTVSAYADGTFNGSTTTGGNNTYAVTPISSTHGNSSLIKSGSDGSVDVGSLKVQGYSVVSVDTITNTLKFTTPGSYNFMTAVGTTGSNTTITTFGTLDTTNGTLRSNTVTTGAPATAGSITGTWAVGSASTWDVTLGTLKSITLTTGADSTPGTIQGTWTLTGASKMQATYADLAEFYEGDQDYEPGTVLVFGGVAEVTETSTLGDTRLAGVVTTNPAYVMNQDQKGIKVCLALAGRVPCKVMGRVKKGDMLTTSDVPGYAVKAITPTLGAIIGKAIEDKDYDEQGIITVAVGRM
jgi:hypothetical protein